MLNAVKKTCGVAAQLWKCTVRGKTGHAGPCAALQPGSYWRWTPRNERDEPPIRLKSSSGKKKKRRSGGGVAKENEGQKEGGTPRKRPRGKRLDRAGSGIR